MNGLTEKQILPTNSESSSNSKETSSKSNTNEAAELSENTTGSDLQQNSDSNEDSFTLIYEEEENSPNDELTKEELKDFELNFNKFYVDSSKNSNGNFDSYIQSGLKLISFFPKVQKFKKQIQKIKEKINLPPETKKKTLILDLDETLIHSDLDFNFKEHDTILKFEYEDEEGKMKEEPIPLILRPGFKEFLDFASEYFELFVFTASYKSYAEPILDYLEKDKKYFKLRLYREHCIVIHNCLYIKDLTIFEGKRNLENIILVDNSIFSFANQLNNGILVTSFYNDKNDSFLSNLIYYLKECILPSSDIRKINQESFGFEEHLERIKQNKN